MYDTLIFQIIHEDTDRFLPCFRDKVVMTIGVLECLPLYKCTYIILSLHGEIFNVTVIRPVGRNFQRGVRSIRPGVWGPFKAPRSPWVFGAKSCNLAISRHFIQT